MVAVGVCCWHAPEKKIRAPAGIPVDALNRTGRRVYLSVCELANATAADDGPCHTGEAWCTRRDSGCMRAGACMTS